MNGLEVSRKRPRNWTKDKAIHVIPTQWIHVNQGDDKRPEYRSGLCGKELKQWDPTMPGTFASMGLFECVMFLLSKVLMWKPGANGATTRKILFLDASKLKRPVRWRLSCLLKDRWRAKTGELLKSFYGKRKAAQKLGQKVATSDHGQSFYHRYIVVSNRVLSRTRVVWIRARRLLYYHGWFNAIDVDRISA